VSVFDKNTRRVLSYDVLWQKSPFSRPAAHIFVSPGRPGDVPAIITQYVAWIERQFNACQIPRNMYLSIFNSFRVIRCLSQCVSPKIAIFTYCSPHFCFPWRRPCDYHAICCMDGKTIQCLLNPSQHIPIYLSDSCPNDVLEIGRNLMRSCNTAMYTLFTQFCTRTT